ncbi:unnamed protein product [Cuscuta epithymum]|uniref:Uncharacterized protein n=1 Tax=Cuscuta epithymum TaxID=186058 RepID=A0AAV0CHP6_9ASTE|nr:unnamed protein product [Cuscuta epithymum]
MADIVFKVSPHGRAVFDKLESGMGTSESTERGTNSVSDSDESTWRTLVLPTKYVRYKRVLEGRKLTDDLTQEALEKMLKRWSKKRRGGRSRLSSMPVGRVQPVKLEGLKAKGAKEYDTILSMCNWIVDEHHKYRPEKCCEFASVDKVGRQFAENGHFYYLDFLVKDLENDGNPLVPVEAVIYRRVPDDFKLWKCHGLKACNMYVTTCDLFIFGPFYDCIVKKQNFGQVRMFCVVFILFLPESKYTLVSMTQIAWYFIANKSVLWFLLTAHLVFTCYFVSNTLLAQDIFVLCIVIATPLG